MKELKLIVALFLVACVMLAVISITERAGAEELIKDFYELKALVVGWELVGAEEKRIDCLAEDGNCWSFFSDNTDGWKIGDVAYLLMWVATEDPEDDEVIDVEWIDHLDEDEMGRFMLVAGW